MDRLKAALDTRSLFAGAPAPALKRARRKAWAVFRYPLSGLFRPKPTLNLLNSYDEKRGMNMAPFDWSQCPAVESIPGKRSGAWVFRGTRTPISTVFENLHDMTVDELIEEFGVTREQAQAVLEFAAHSAEAPTLRS